MKIFSSIVLKGLQLRTVCVALATSLVLAACGSSNSPSSFLQVMHAVSDAPRVNVYVNDNLILSEVDFRAGSNFISLLPDSASIRVEAIIPGGNIDIIDITEGLVENERKTLIVAGGVETGNLQEIIVARPSDAIPAGNARALVTHAASDAPPVYLALSAPNFPVDQLSFAGPFAFGETIGPVVFPEGAYQVVVAAGAPPFDDDDVVFKAPTFFFAAGTDVQAVAVNSTVPSLAGDDASPISVVLLDSTGSTDVFDENTGADLRVVHNSPGAPAVNVVVDDLDTTIDEGLEIVTNLSFSEVAGYLDPPVTPGRYGVDVVLNADPDTTALAFDADLMAGGAYTVIANNVVSEITEWVLFDDYRRVFTEAKVRLVHGASGLGNVDVYVIPSSAALTPADTDPTIPSFQFGTETGFLSLPDDSYDIYITGEGSDVPLLSVLGQPLAANGVYTAIARDANPLPPNQPAGLILLDDFAP